MSGNPGIYTPEAARIESAIDVQLQPLLVKAVEEYHMSVEDFFMLVSRAADMEIMAYNRETLNKTVNEAKSAEGTSKER